MHINLNTFTASRKQKFDWERIKPGTIWELSRLVQSPLEFSHEEQQLLYSETALRFLSGNSPPRYVMIVREPELAVEQDEWQTVSVMVLSVQTEFLSDLDLLLPAEVSGVGRDLLAQTWHVLPMLVSNLSHLVGQRLSRQMYDVLLSVGDYHHGLVDKAPSRQEIQLSGLNVGVVSGQQQPEIQAFHRQEEAWSDVLKVPLAAYCTYLKTMKFTDAILNAALQVEQEFLDVSSSVLDQTPVLLSQWFQNIVDGNWHPTEGFWDSQAAIVASRSGDRAHEHRSNNSEEIAALIKQMSSGDEHKQRQAVKRIGEIGTGNSNAVAALINLLRTSQDDETLWIAVESLWQIDPGNPAIGVSRARLIDLGMQLGGHSVALAVALMQKVDGQVGVLLRVYPTNNAAYLPANLKLILLDESEQILREVVARRADNYIQIRLSGEPSEQFSVRVALGDANITEYFVI